MPKALSFTRDGRLVVRTHEDLRDAVRAAAARRRITVPALGANVSRFTGRQSRPSNSTAMRQLLEAFTAHRFGVYLLPDGDPDGERLPASNIDQLRVALRKWVKLRGSSAWAMVKGQNGSGSTVTFITGSGGDNVRSDVFFRVLEGHGAALLILDERPSRKLQLD